MTFFITVPYKVLYTVIFHQTNNINYCRMKGANTQK